MDMISLIAGLRNIDLLSVGIAVAGMVVMGVAVLFNNLKSSSNRVFFYLAITASIWGVINYLSYQRYQVELSFWLLRFVMFFAVWSTFFTFTFAYVFPSDSVKFPTYYKWIIAPITIITSILTLTTLVFSGVAEITDGRISKVINGPGIFIFAITVVALNLGSILFLARKISKSNSSERKPLQTILYGIYSMLFLIITFNFVLPAFFDNIRFIPLGALFLFPFIAFTSYAIMKHKIFNIRIMGTVALVFALSLVTFIEVILSDDLVLTIYRSSIFLLVLCFGALLIRGVLHEVKQRERLEVLTRELGETNESLQNAIKQRESLVHLINHKVKSSFTRSKYIFAGMLDGTYGEITPEIKKRAEQGLESDDAGIKTVDLVLNTTNLQGGTVKYDMKTTDLKEVVLKSVAEKKAPAEGKGLQMETEIKDGVCNVLGDSIWLKEAVNNLIENSIRYTREGKITVGLEKRADLPTARAGGAQAGKALIYVKDTGIGITEEDKKSLFTAGGRGKGSAKINVDSTGYGLYSVKLIVEAHKGRVWGESEGANKGSAFFIELPLA